MSVGPPPRSVGPPDRGCYGVGGSCRRSCARHRTDRIAPPCSLRPAAQATNFSRGPQRIRYLRSRNHLPSRVGAPVDFRLHVADRAITEIEVAFQLRHGEMLPFICLPQERAALERTEGGGSPVQRSDGAVSAHVFHDSFPVRTHELGSPCSPAAPRKCDTIIFQFVSKPAPTARMVLKRLIASIRLKITLIGNPCRYSRRHVSRYP